MGKIPIYPFQPFKDLSNKTIRDNFNTSRTISIDDLREVIASIDNPNPKIKGKSIEDCILSIFQDENYRFGPKNFINENRDRWFTRFKYFTSREKPLRMVLMAFPFKVPVPLKTARITADLAELLQIVRLRYITQWIGSIYKPGAIVTILAEGILGEAHGVSENDRQLYRESLERLLDISGIGSEVEIHNLDEILDVIPNFRRLWQEQVSELRSLSQQKDARFLKDFANTYRSIYHMVPTRGYPDDLLMDVYNESIPTEALPQDARKLRGELEIAATEAVFQYQGFLNARDASHYLDKLVPGYIKLTVSPKPLNLGIMPININTHILPHHGVPVYDVNSDQFTVEYLIDVRRDTFPYKPVYLHTDNEEKPFYYERLG